MSTNNAINNSTKTTVYTANDTWTKDSRTNVVQIFMWDGGGGGGSGRRGASTAAGGGGGAAGGACAHVIYPASFFGATESVVVGLGGSGGAAQTLDNTDGNNGTAGGPSSFGNLVPKASAVYPPYGHGGSNVQVYFGDSRYSINQTLGAPTPKSFAYGDITDGGDAVYQGSSLTHDRPNVCAAGGGGGGGGANSVTERSGGDGSGVSKLDGTIIIAGGSGGTESGTINGSNGADFAVSGGILSGGCGGGGGGGQHGGASAGKGGNGGFPGGGGGGGGGSLNGTNSGAGGDGANGKIIVIEYF